MDARSYKEELLKALYEPYKKCMACPLGSLGRTTVVFGEGNPDADLLFIGEGPGKDEDEQGRPFVGRSGQLLNRVLARVGIERSDVYITNIVKCRPPGNRAPTPLEASTCMSILLANQIKIIRPRIICPLGSIALNNLLGKPSSITKMRGAPLAWNDMLIIPTFHPAYILRNQSQASVWLEDFMALKKRLDAT
jgi:uracil-DNA glycosylase